MLEQYNKDFPQHSHNQFSEENSLNSSVTRRKLIFTLSGATFALVFFLFLMGIFRDDESPNPTNENKGASRKEIAALSEKIKDLQCRLEQIEGYAVASRDSSKNNNVKESDMPGASQFNKQDSVALQDDAMQGTALQGEEQPARSSLSGREDAINMTNQAMLRFIANASPLANDDSDMNDEVVQPNVPAPVKANPQPTKQTSKSSQQKSGTTYVVKKGDTLSKISQRFYGTPNRWKVIYDTNKDKIPNMNNLRVGTTLQIPEKK